MADERKPAGFTVTRTGRCITNVSGAELFQTVADGLGFDLDSWYLQYRVDAKKGVVRASVVPVSAAGAIPVLRSRNRRLLTVYIGSIFAEYPNLRVQSTQFVPVAASSDGRAVLFTIKFRDENAPTSHLPF